MGKTSGVPSMGKTSGIPSIGKTSGVPSIGKTSGVPSKWEKHLPPCQEPASTRLQILSPLRQILFFILVRITPKDPFRVLEANTCV